MVQCSRKDLSGYKWVSSEWLLGCLLLALVDIELVGTKEGKAVLCRGGCLTRLEHFVSSAAREV